MISDDEIERIEQYYRGELSGEARSAFEEKMVSDIDFAREVNAYTAIMAGITQEGERDFAAMVNNWEKEVDRKEIKNSILPRWLWAAAAVVLISILPLGIWYYHAQQHSPQQLFNTYFKPYDDVVSSRSGTPHDDNMFLAGMELYNSQDYIAAIPMFESFLVGNPQHRAALFYFSVSNLAVNNLAKAETGFLKLHTQPVDVFKEAAEWYLALTYLKENKVTDSNAMLKKIIENKNHAFFEEAKSLYEKEKK